MQSSNQAALGQSQRSRDEQNRSRQSTGEIQAEDIKEWTSHCLQWVIRDAPTLLQSAVEGFASAPEGVPREHELLQVMIGGSVYRLHVVVTMTHLEENESEETSEDTLQGDSQATLSIYLSLLRSEMIPVCQSEHASIFLGLKSHDTTSTKVGSRVPWLMRDTMEWDFHVEANWFQCPMVKVDHILEDLARCGSNDITFVIQIQTPEAMTPEPSRTDCQLVPSSLLEGLESAIDNKNTGDIMFICLEYGDEADLANQFANQVNPSGSASRSAAAGTDIRVYRKRILYAHSDILQARSEYFKALLDFKASTNPQTVHGLLSDRHRETIFCNDADFQTLYWLLHYIYCNELELSSEEPLIDIVKRMDMASDHKARRLMGQDDALPVANEWNWHFSSDGAADSDTASNIGSSERGDHACSQTMGDAMSVDSADLHTQPLAPTGTGSSPLSSDRVSAVVAPLSPRASTAASRARISARQPDQANSLQGKAKLKSLSRGATGPIPANKASCVVDAASPYSVAATNAQNQMTPPQAGSTIALPVSRNEDPHSHPTVAPPPASSFAIYVLAHQYSLTGLQERAQDALLDKLTPATACSLLLASYKYKDLYAEVKSYVVQNWVDIQQDNAFLNAIQEVSNGMWGSDGGLVLHSLFKRLHT